MYHGFPNSQGTLSWYSVSPYSWETLYNCRTLVLESIAVFKYELLLFLAVVCYLAVYSRRSQAVQLLYQPTKANQSIISRLNKVISSFSPPFILQGAVSQIFVAAKMSPNFSIKYTIESFKLEDGGSLKLELYPPNFYDMPETAPVVFLLLGVCGSTREKYPRVASRRARSKGYRTVVINKRGFARTPLTSARFFHKDELEDFNTVISHFHKRLPKANKYLVGTSQGALYTLKYLITHNKTTPIRCAVSISNPFDNEKNSQLITPTYWGGKAMKVIAQQMKALISFHRENHHFHELMRRTIGHADLHSILDSCFKPHDIFERLVHRIGEYETLGHFYETFKINNDLHKVNTPVLFINNKEDPFISFKVIPFEQLYANEKFISLFTNKGGHVEYYSGLLFDWWAYKAAMEYIQTFEEGKHL